jgi:hypothetical protein
VQVVPVVQALASSHGLPVRTTGAGHPLAGTQAPTEWHWSAPGQVPMGAPEAHVPLVAQTSPTVHALPSEHEPVVETVKSNGAA